MSKEIWNTLNPESGKGEATVKVGGSVHTGRLDRISTPVFKPKDPALAEKVASITLSVTQKGETEFVTMSDVSVGKEGGEIIMSGRSNSSKLAFTLGEGNLYVPLLPNYTAAGITVRNNTPISGDPGAVEAFDFSRKFTVPVNSTTDVRTKIINIATAGGQTAAATITQEAADPFIALESEGVEIPPEGTPVSVPVKSSIEWETE